MNEEKLIEIVTLANGQTLESGQIGNTTTGLVLHVENGDLLALEGQLTKQNLTEVSISNADGAVYGKYYNMQLASLYKNMDTGAVVAELKMEDKTEVRLKALEEGYNLHDDALAEIGVVVSGIVEGGAM